MALRFTLKKKDYDNDERTVPADDFLSLAARGKKPHPQPLSKERGEASPPNPLSKERGVIT